MRKRKSITRQHTPRPTKANRNLLGEEYLLAPIGVPRLQKPEHEHLQGGGGKRGGTPPGNEDRPKT